MPVAICEPDLQQIANEMASRAKLASRVLATVSTTVKNRWLRIAADSLDRHHAELLEANAKDVAQAAKHELTPAQVDRLRLTPSRLESAANGLREVAALPDPVGRVIEGSTRPNGLEVRKVGVPLGVLFFLYESRPNVTVDAAALSVKSGNAILLRGGKEAIHTNLAVHRLLQVSLRECGLPEDAVQIVRSTDRSIVGHFLRMNGLIDLVIPRGGENLIRRVAEEATMPVLKHYKGVCHVYVHSAANLQVAEQIVINAKCQRPGVCNAMECLLVDASIAAEFLPRVSRSLQKHDVEIRGCARTLALLPDAVPANDADYGMEYLELILAVKVVDGFDHAVEHIHRYGSQHTEAIVTRDIEAARKFSATVDAAAVMVNASTRFNDGFELGLGAEIGISTDKFHARGPCGLNELTTYKYVVTGSGHVRE